MKTITVEICIPEDATSAPSTGDYGRFDRAMLASWLATTEDVSVRELTDKQIEERADGNAQRAYWATVQGFVDDVKEQIKSGDITDSEGAREYLEQSIDGCHDVIYTYAAQEVLRISQNDAAYFDDFGTEGAIDDSGIQWSKLAYCALLADVMEEIGDLDDLFAEEEEEEETEA